MAHTNRKICKTLPKQTFDYHSRKCVICRHPDRATIEEEFVHWGGVWDIARIYQLGDYRSVYRHAHATGLTLRRRENLHSVLDIFLEKARGANMSGDSILRAIRAYSCVDSLGRWVDPPTQMNYSIAHSGAQPGASAAVPTMSPVTPAPHFIAPARPASAEPAHAANSTAHRSTVIDLDLDENVEPDENDEPGEEVDENDEPDVNEEADENDEPDVIVEDDETVESNENEEADETDDADENVEDDETVEADENDHEPCADGESALENVAVPEADGESASKTDSALETDTDSALETDGNAALEYVAVPNADGESALEADDVLEGRDTDENDHEPCADGESALENVAVPGADGESASKTDSALETDGKSALKTVPALKASTVAKSKPVRQPAPVMNAAPVSALKTNSALKMKTSPAPPAAPAALVMNAPQTPTPFQPAVTTPSQMFGVLTDAGQINGGAIRMACIPLKTNDGNPFKSTVKSTFRPAHFARRHRRRK